MKSSAFPADKKNRLDTIDILRGVAALSVGLYHIWGHDGGYPWHSIGVVPTNPNPNLTMFLLSPLRWGYLGVSLFLVLSGFCIHLPFARKRCTDGDYGFNGPIFFTRRVWRLYPAYFVAVLGTACFIWIGSLFPSLNVAVHLPLPTAWDVISHLTMLHGFFEGQFYSIASVFWSLSLEFQLYLAYPLFLFGFKKIGVVHTVIILVGISLAWRYFAIVNLGGGLISIAAEGPFVSMGVLPARMVEWLLGALLAEIFVKRNTERFTKVLNHTPTYSIASLVIFSFAIASTLHKETWLMTDPLFGLAFTLFIAGIILHSRSSEIHTSGTTISRWLIRLGVLSYSFYLIHSQLSWLLAPLVPYQMGAIGPILLRIGFLLLSLVPITIYFRWFEKPFLYPPKSESKLMPFYDNLGNLFGVRKRHSK